MVFMVGIGVMVDNPPAMEAIPGAIGAHPCATKNENIQESRPVLFKKIFSYFFAWWSITCSHVFLQQISYFI